jgi:hypothetical protein
VTSPFGWTVLTNGQGGLVVVTENLNSKILMMEPAQDRNRHDLTDRLPAPEKRRVLVER